MFRDVFCPILTFKLLEVLFIHSICMDIFAECIHESWCICFCILGCNLGWMGDHFKRCLLRVSWLGRFHYCPIRKLGWNLLPYGRFAHHMDNSIKRYFFMYLKKFISNCINLAYDTARLSIILYKKNLCVSVYK